MCAKKNVSEIPHPAFNLEDPHVCVGTGRSEGDIYIIGQNDDYLYLTKGQVQVLMLKLANALIGRSGSTPKGFDISKCHLDIILTAKGNNG